ncbi:YkoP family protein [Tepidibacillus sp. LV47]|uniref:YkoP family protein n=1 Tax=Tepidibacillus sp. LV47 TaxID=3398228 RepID=UPI003AAD7D04
MNAGLFELWRVLDFIYQHITRLEYVDKKSNIFRVVFCKYRGPDLITRDGVIIHHGDPIVKLHIYNWKLTKMLKGITNETRLGLTTLRIVKDSLPTLADYIYNHPKGENVKALVGTTFLHRGIHHLGFDVDKVPNTLKFKWKEQYLRLILYIIHPNGKERLKLRSEELVPKRVYMSKDQLFKRYLLPQEEDVKEERR